MTTKHSPLNTLKAQADDIAARIKAVERKQVVQKVNRVRKASFKVGIVMDDNIITVEMPWATIRASTEVALSEYILKQMMGVRDHA